MTYSFHYKPLSLSSARLLTPSTFACPVPSTAHFIKSSTYPLWPVFLDGTIHHRQNEALQSEIFVVLHFADVSHIVSFYFVLLREMKLLETHLHYFSHILYLPRSWSLLPVLFSEFCCCKFSLPKPTHFLACILLVYTFHLNSVLSFCCNFSDKNNTVSFTYIVCVIFVQRMTAERLNCLSLS